MSNETNLKKSILDLESLELKFKNKLIEYQNAYTTYVSGLNVNTSTGGLQQLKTMNDELISMNAQINDQIQKQYSTVNQHYQENAQANQGMLQTFQRLEAEREAIRKMMVELNSIKEENNDQRLRIDQGVSKYIFWGIIALVTMFITVKVVFYPEADTNMIRLFFNACIFILLILWVMNLNSVTVTFIILFLIAMIIITRIS